MDVPAIDWRGFSWEAFATLATGCAAVAAAWLVGRRQMTILERQVGLDELKLRGDLFERRYAVYQATAKFLADVTRFSERNADIQRDFLAAMDQARFLFRPEVHAQLYEVWNRSGFVGAGESLRAGHVLDHFDDGEVPAEFASIIREHDQRQVEREHDTRLWLIAKREDVSKLFGDELRLSANADPNLAVTRLSSSRR